MPVWVYAAALCVIRVDQTPCAAAGLAGLAQLLHGTRYIDIQMSRCSFSYLN
jgi:hypothetical protein